MRETRLVNQTWNLINLFQDLGRDDQEWFLNELNDPDQALMMAAEMMPPTDEEFLEAVKKGWENLVDEEVAETEAREIQESLENLKTVEWGPEEIPSDEYLKAAAKAMNPILEGLINQ